jgi:hypothetical protein
MARGYELDVGTQQVFRCRAGLVDGSAISRVDGSAIGRVDGSAIDARRSARFATVGACIVLARR